MDNLMSELTRPTSCYDGVGRCRTESIMEEAAARIAELEASLSDRWEGLNVLDGEIDALRERIAALKVENIKLKRQHYRPAPKLCEAVQYSDQTVCVKCDLAWDTNDDDRPECAS